MIVSVIVPCLKRDDAAERCLAEIRRQAASGGAELDLVVVEGVSPVGRARNVGLERAVGDYVVWVDADDDPLEGWWTALCAAVEDSVADVVVWDYELVGKDGRQSVFYGREEFLDGPDFLSDVLREELQHGFLWNKMVRRTLWQDVRFDEGVSVLEDFLALPQVLKRARVVRYVSKALYAYRQNEDSLTHADLRNWTRESLPIAQRRIRECGNLRAAVVGACMIAYYVLVNEVLGLEVGDTSEQKRFLRKNFLHAWADSRLCWKWKVKFALAGFGCLGVMKTRWERMKSGRQ